MRGVGVEEIARDLIAAELEFVSFRILPEAGGFVIIRAAQHGAAAAAGR